jgi:hypothetical protein
LLSQDQELLLKSKPVDMLLRVLSEDQELRLKLQPNQPLDDQESKLRLKLPDTEDSITHTYDV